MLSDITVRLGEQADWPCLRECFLQAFQDYPLYTYMIPDDARRREFMRRYLDANYEGYNKLGSGITLCIEIQYEKNKKMVMLVSRFKKLF